MKQQVKKKILIVTHFSKKYGYGHFSRSENLYKALKKNYTFSLSLFKTRNLKTINKNIQFSSFEKKNIKFFDLIIFDLPKVLLKYINLSKIKNKILVIDQILKSKNYFYLSQNLHLSNNKKNSKSGFEYLLLSEKINFINLKKIKKKEDIIVFGGTTSKVPKKIINFCFREREKYKFKFFDYKKFKNSTKFLTQLKSSKSILMRFGVTTYEAISLGIKPIIWTLNEKKDRKKDIRNLERRNLINIFNENKFYDYSKQRNKIKIIRYDKINSFLGKILKSNKN